MAKIFLFGYYGFGNLGDELLADYFLSLLREEFPAIEVVLLTAGPSERESLPKIFPVNRWRLWRITKMINHGDLLLGGGGSIFQDTTSKRSLLYYLALVEAARRRRARVFLTGQGFGPLSPVGAAATSRVLNHAEAISCRDKFSGELLQKIGISRPVVRVGVDPLWNMKMNRQWGNIPEAHSIGVFLRKGERSLRLKFLSLLHLKYGAALEVYSLAPEDEEFLRALCKTGGLPPVRAISSLSQMERASTRFSLVISERYHGLLLAARAGVPGIGLGNDPKIRSLCQELGLTYYSWGETDLPGKVLNRVGEIESDAVSEKERVIAAVTYLEKKGEEDRGWLVNRIGEALAE